MRRRVPSPVPERLPTEPGTQVLLVADSLAEQRTSMDLYAGWIHDALLASNDGSRYELLRHPVNIQRGRLALKWRALRQRYVTIPRAIRWAHADIVHILDPAYGHLIPTAAPARVVVTCHDLIPLESDNWNGSSKTLSLGWHLYRRAIGHLTMADALVVPTYATKRRLVRLLGARDDKA